MLYLLLTPAGSQPTACGTWNGFVVIADVHACILLLSWAIWRALLDNLTLII